MAVVIVSQTKGGRRRVQECEVSLSADPDLVRISFVLRVSKRKLPFALELSGNDSIKSLMSYVHSADARRPLSQEFSFDEIFGPAGKALQERLASS